MSKKGKSTKKPVQTSFFKRPNQYKSFAELAEYSEGCVYLITRLKEDRDGKVSVTTLGTGFLCGSYRLLTCAHVMASEDEVHSDNDVYCFVNRTREGYHRAFLRLKENQTLFIDQGTDSAIIYLSDDFYFSKEGEMLRSPEKFLPLAKKRRRIGVDVGILGYPMQSVYLNKAADDVDIDDVYLRADSGVVNLSYARDGVELYDFTMAFNPGNSGGPIIEIKSGKVIAYVHGFNSIPIKMAVDQPNEEWVRKGAPKNVYSPIRALYSVGVSTENLLLVEETRGLAFE